MNKKTLLFSSLFACAMATNAQQAFNTIEYLDINNINAGHLVHGDMWYNTTQRKAACEYPKASGKNVASLGSVWFGGYRTGTDTLVAAQTFRQTGNDYYPGPIDTTITGSTAAYQYAGKWAKIWKVNKSTIDSFRALATHTLANTPAAILGWPAKGNVNATGAQQAALTINRALAPFVDVDNNGSYDPLAGDYPDIKGDQALWCIFNDYMMPKTNTRTGAIGLEVQRMAYAYHRHSLLDNTLFYEYTIRNARNVSLSGFRMGFFADPDIGYGSDDYIGFDSARRMGYAYNSKSPDGQGAANAYGADIPAAGIAIMEFPGDAYPSLVPAGAFVPISNSLNGVTTTTDPASAREYMYVLTGRNRANQEIHDDRAAGAASNAFGSGPVTRYAFPGDPDSAGQWSQCQNGLAKNMDQRFLLATDSLPFAPGTTYKIGFALVVSPDAGACPVVDLRGLRRTADSALNAYWHPPAATGVRTLRTSKTLKIFPNPTTGILYVAAPDAAQGTVSVFNATGQRMQLPTNTDSARITIGTGNLAAGMYLVEYRSGQSIANNIFVKQ